MNYIEVNMDFESAKILRDVCLDVMNPNHLITWLDDEKFDTLNKLCETLEYQLKKEGVIE